MKQAVVAAALIGVLAAGSTGASASVITFAVPLTLDSSQIYQCGGDAYPVGTYCWADNLSRYTLIPRTLIGPEDIVRLQVRFVGGDRLVWGDDGLSSLDGVDEQAQVGLWDSQANFGYDNGMWHNALAFNGVRGQLHQSRLQWTFAGSSGGLVSQSRWSGVTNLTDTSFAFSGISAEIGPFVGGTGLPHEVDRLAVFFTGGRFSIQRHEPTEVPEPTASWLLGIGLYLIWRKGHERPF